MNVIFVQCATCQGSQPYRQRGSRDRERVAMRDGVGGRSATPHFKLQLLRLARPSEKEGRHVSATTIPDRAKKPNCRKPHPKGKAHGRQVATAAIGARGICSCLLPTLQVPAPLGTFRIAQAPAIQIFRCGLRLSRAVAQRHVRFLKRVPALMPVALRTCGDQVLP